MNAQCSLPVGMAVSFGLTGLRGQRGRHNETWRMGCLMAADWLALVMCCRTSDPPDQYIDDLVASPRNADRRRPDLAKFGRKFGELRAEIFRNRPEMLVKLGPHFGRTLNPNLVKPGAGLPQIGPRLMGCGPKLVECGELRHSVCRNRLRA